MGEGFKSSGDGVEDGTVVARAEHFQGNLIRRLGLTTDGVVHLLLAVFVMLNELVGTVAVVFIDCAVSGQHQLYVQLLHFLERLNKITQRVIRAAWVDANMRSDFWQQVITDDEHLVLWQIKATVARGVAGCPDDVNLSATYPEDIPVVDQAIG